MKIQENTHAWRNISARQLASQPAAQQDAEIKDVLESSPGQSVSNVQQSLGEKALARAQSGLQYGLASGLQLALGASCCTTLCGQVLLGTGLLTGAYSWLQFHRFSHDMQLDAKIDAAAQTLATTMVQPGDSETTFVDSRFYTEGRFQNAREEHDRGTGAVLHRHIDLGGPTRLVVDEDCKAGEVTIQSTLGTHAFPGEIALPTGGDQLLHLCHTSGKAKVDQRIDQNGASIFYYALADQPSKYGHIASVDHGVAVTGNPRTWQNGNVLFSDCLLNPLVHADELGDSTPRLATGTFEFGESQNGWDLVARTNVPELAPGEYSGQLLHSSFANRFKPSSKVSLTFPQTGGKEVVVQPKGTPSYEVPGKLSKDGTLSYQQDGHSLEQTFATPGVTLSVALPEGNVRIRQSGQGTAQAELFWGDVPKGPVPVTVNAGGYEVSLGDKVYGATPAVPLGLLS